MKQPWRRSLIICLTKAWSGWLLNSCLRMNSRRCSRCSKWNCTCWGRAGHCGWHRTIHTGVGSCRNNNGRLNGWRHAKSVVAFGSLAVLWLVYSGLSRLGYITWHRWWMLSSSGCWGGYGCCLLGGLNIDWAQKTIFRIMGCCTTVNARPSAKE